MCDDDIVTVCCSLLSVDLGLGLLVASNHRRYDPARGAGAHGSTGQCRRRLGSVGLADGVASVAA